MSTLSSAGRIVSGRRIIIGLSGGIACYKLCSVVSTLVQQQAEVTVVMTDAAARFVTPLTFQALSGRPVYDSLWRHIEAHDPQHIALARNAELMLIAPCTMEMLAKLAHGHAGDMVSLIASAMDKSRQRILIAPSMNETMWNQLSTQRNVKQLAEDGYRIIPPEKGWQACRTEGTGRLAEPDTLLECLCEALSE